MTSDNLVVNTDVVKAVLFLRGISLEALSNLVGETAEALAGWLDSTAPEGDELEIDSQLEVLRVIGFSGGVPRKDTVHFWRVNETLFSRASSSYWALKVLLQAFGPAQMAYIARESEPAFSTKSKFFFALSFAGEAGGPGFYAMVEVKTHPLRTASLNPESIPLLSWAPDVMGVLLDNQKYDKLGPGSLKSPQLRGYLDYTAETRRWEALRELAQSRGLTAQQLLGVLTSVEELPNVAPPISAISQEAPPPLIASRAQPELSVVGGPKLRVHRSVDSFK